MAASVTPEISTSAIRYALNITGLSEEFNHRGKIVEANLLRRASFLVCDEKSATPQKAQSWRWTGERPKFCFSVIIFLVLCEFAVHIYVQDKRRIDRT